MLAFGHKLVTNQRGNFTFPGYASGILPDGNYTATLSASGVSDIAGTTMAATFTKSFFVLAGDASRDKTVDLTDFTILAANFNQSGKTFSQGDFNYDGTVGLADFTILASRFNQTLASAAAPVRSVQAHQPASSESNLPRLDELQGRRLFEDVLI